MEGQLLTAVRPFLRLFALFTLIPPPSFYDRNSFGCRRRLMSTIFGCYCCCIILLVIHVTFVNISILYAEIEMLDVEDFTSAQGFMQKACYTFQILVIHGNMLLYSADLGRIYMDIDDLEQDIDAAAQCFGGVGQRTRFRSRLVKRIGLWLVLLLAIFPWMSIPSLTELMDWRHKILTEFVLIVMQTKLMEYGLFVVLVQELLLRLRHTLLRLQLELSACEQLDLLQALCAAVQLNKQLVARVWKLVGKLEAYFTLPMICLFLSNSLAVLHIVNWAYIQALNPYDCAICRYSRFGNMVILLLDLLIPCWLSRNCIDTYLSFSRIIHSIRCGSGNSNPQLLSNCLREYALQMEHLKLRFSCSNFFDIDLKNFRGVVLTLFTYSIILIQFKLQDFVLTKNQISNNSSKSFAKAL